MKRSTAMISAAINSYQKEVKRLKSCSPDWKPISLKEYMREYHNKLESKSSRKVS